MAKVKSSGRATRAGIAVGVGMFVALGVVACDFQPQYLGDVAARISSDGLEVVVCSQISIDQLVVEISPAENEASGVKWRASNQSASAARQILTADSLDSYFGDVETEALDLSTADTVTVIATSADESAANVVAAFPRSKIASLDDALWAHPSGGPTIEPCD